MYSKDSRLQLEETVGYECYVIETCLREDRERKGTVSPMTLIIGDNYPLTIKLEINQTVSLGGNSTGFPSTLSPLLFCAGYKILDMIIEWVIRENGYSCPFPFKEKIKLLGANQFEFPDFLKTDTELRDAVTACYRNLVKFRNAIVHGHWGRNIEGSLHFDFNKNNIQVKQFISLNEVEAWSEAMLTIANFLINPSLRTTLSLDGLRLKCNDFVNLHKKSFNIKIPRFFKVIRQTISLPFTVDIQRIRGEVAKQAGGTTPVFSLRIEIGVEGDRTVWELPPEFIPSDDFPLDSAWDKYKLKN